MKKLPARYLTTRKGKFVIDLNRKDPNKMIISRASDTEPGVFEPILETKATTDRSKVLQTLRRLEAFAVAKKQLESAMNEIGDVSIYKDDWESSMVGTFVDKRLISARAGRLRKEKEEAGPKKLSISSPLPKKGAPTKSFKD